MIPRSIANCACRNSALRIGIVKESTLRNCPNIKVYRAPSIADDMVSEQFRKKKVAAAAIWRKTQLSKRTNGARSRATETEKIVQEGLERFGLSESDLKSSPGSDPRKVAIAGFIHQSTTTPQSWTAERLQMKCAANVSQQLSRAKKAAKPKIKPAKPVV